MKKICIKIIIVINLINILFVSKVFAVSPAVTPKTTITPIASPSANLTPTAEDEKVLEIRQANLEKAMKEKLDQIKEKIEKKAYIGTILDITDSTLTLSSFRGKQRVRLSAETKIIGASKKEITVKELAVEDRIIAMGEVDTNGTLEAKRVVVTPVPKTAPAKRVVFYATITEINSKASTITLTEVGNLDKTLSIKTDKNTVLVNPKDTKIELKLKDLKESQKVLIVYLSPTGDETPIAKTLFLLP